ncbi:MAG: [FeFe] hydrogenase H-cluster maturation GTPase HydF [Lachnoclostridium sp.]|nr:[FeFe] hydrogenase H-cluster maturation GTPase HydF [Lachnoclostridium sp.]
MTRNNTPKGERLQIALFGRTNVGKSSVINAITGQNLAIVSEVKGTTTDPVYKAMELLPIGPVTIVDTPGLDDESKLGIERIKRAKDVLNKSDLILVIADGQTAEEDLSFEQEIILLAKKKKIPALLVMNKQDLWKEKEEKITSLGDISISAVTGYHIHEIKEMIANSFVADTKEQYLVRDLISKNDTIVLVVPIDESAPKGRLILPQQQVIRDILEVGAIAVICKDTEFESVLASSIKKPSLVITDSQVFGKVAELTPKEIPLTSFSMLFARYKGDLELFIKSIDIISSLKDGDTILIAEGCTHHRQCEDIGTVKIPNWLRKYTGKNLVFETSSGGTYPEQLDKYALVIHCGGCMLSRREMLYRLSITKEQHVPIINFGILIAEMHGILERVSQIYHPIFDKTPDSDKA